MINAPSDAAVEEATSFDSAQPDDLEAAVPAIVMAAMIRLGTAATLVPQIPKATPNPEIVEVRNRRDQDRAKQTHPA